MQRQPPFSLLVYNKFFLRFSFYFIFVHSVFLFRRFCGFSWDLFFFPFGLNAALLLFLKILLLLLVATKKSYKKYEKNAYAQCNMDFFLLQFACVPFKSHKCRIKEFFVFRNNFLKTLIFEDLKLLEFKFLRE